MSKLLKISLAECYDPPHDFWRTEDEGWLRCSKCDMVTSVEVLKYWFESVTP